MHRPAIAVALALALSSTLAGAPAIAQGPPPNLPADALVDRVDPARAEFLRRNVVVDGPVTGGLSFSFPADFYDGRLFLLGESHGSAAPQVLDLELFSHLNERIGLVDYVAEIDPVQADVLNRYLASGDEAMLDRVFDHWNRGSQWANTAYEDKMRGLRELHRSLPAGRRIRLHGLDAIQDWSLLADELATRGVAIDRDALLATRATDARARLAADALRAADPQPDAYLLAALERQAAGADREATIFGNYRELVTSGVLGERPAYGLWGTWHVLQAPANGARPWAARVRDSTLPASGRMRTIVLHSLDSAVQFPVQLPEGPARVRFADANVDGPVVKLDGSATLRDASAARRIRVFRIDGGGTPYAAGQELVALRSSMDRGLQPDPGIPTTGFTQYVGVFRDSDWAPPREGSGRVLTP